MRHTHCKWKRSVVLLIVGLTVFSRAYTQILYASAINTGGVATVFYIDVSTCESCIVSPTSPNIGTQDFVMLPDGSVLNIDEGGFRRLPPPPAVNILWQTANPQSYFAGQLAPNGLVYLVGAAGLASYNPANNAISFIGPWPASVGEVWDVFYIDGILYGNGVDQGGLGIFITINTSNPVISVVTPAPLNYTEGEGGNWNGTEGLFFADASHTVYFYNPQDGSTTTLCDINTEYSIISLTTLPPGLPNYPCLPVCIADAGEMAPTTPLNPCINTPLNLPVATQVVLDGDDLLQYVVFTNLADTLGSIILVSDTPDFNFGPPFQAGVTYYIAAVAGDALNGNVNLNGACLDFSNALTLIWRPLPTIQLSVPNASLCPGACVSVNAVLSGTGAFSVSGTLLSNGAGIGSFNQVFTGNTGLFQVCVPAGTPAGPLSVQVTGLTDTWCICN